MEVSILPNFIASPEALRAEVNIACGTQCPVNVTKNKQTLLEKLYIRPEHGGLLHKDHHEA